MEIKFRVWNKENSRMIYPERSDCAVWVDGENGWALLSHFTGKIEEIVPMNKEWENLMMATESKDKNEKLIYNGDVVKRMATKYDFDKPDGEETYYVEEVSIIEWRQNGFWVKDEGFGWEGEDLWDWEQIEVIGNVFETPELLKSDGKK